MQRGIAGVASAMNAYSERLNIVANNVANIQTAGFKKQTASVKSFDEYLIKEMSNTQRKIKGSVGTVSLASDLMDAVTIFEQGIIKETNYHTDFAINGDGFFVIETQNGLRYTRNGSFTFNDEGYLVTQNGDYVLSEEGRIFSQDRDIAVSLEGYINNGAKMRLVSFNDLNLLENDGSSYYMTADENVIEARNSYIVQGSLENSNVDVLEETRILLELRRNYESCQMVIKMLDATMDKAVNDIGKI